MGDRPSHAAQQVGIDVLGAANVPFPEELPQHAAPAPLVGRADLGHRQGVQPRAQVGQGGRPARRGAAAVSSRPPPWRAARLIRWNRASGGRALVDVLQQHRPARGGGDVRRSRSRITAPRPRPRPAPDGSCRRPPGPTSARQPPRQAGQLDRRDGFRVGGPRTNSSRGDGGPASRLSRSCRAMGPVRVKITGGILASRGSAHRDGHPGAGIRPASAVRVALVSRRAADTSVQPSGFSSSMGEKRTL